MKELTQMNPDLHRLEIPFLDIYTTVYILRTPEGAVLVDTGTYPEDVDNYIVPALAELGICAECLKYVVISHNHRDHAGGLTRFAQLYPNTEIVAGSEACAERVPEKTVQVMQEGDLLCGVLKILHLPGHTGDCLGVLDLRTDTLLSGDGLQLFGIYGSGNWGANISHIAEHLALCERLKKEKIQRILSCHNYHPCDWRAEGKEQVDRYLDACVDALCAVRDFVKQHPQWDGAALSEAYNASSGLPKVGPHVMNAVRKAMENGVF